MPFEDEDLRHLEAAQGFVTLGLYFGANGELELRSPDDQKFRVTHENCHPPLCRGFAARSANA